MTKCSGAYLRWNSTCILMLFPNNCRTTVDGHEIMNIHTPSQGFWSWGGFHGHNIWSHGGKNAPFDQPVSLLCKHHRKCQYISDLYFLAIFLYYIFFM